MASLYKMNHPRRGKAVIINNVNFNTQARLNRRKGSRQDSDSLADCLRGLNFTAEKHEDKTTGEISKIFEKVAAEDHSDADCLVVSLMSHGGKEGISGTDFNRRNFMQLQDERDGNYRSAGVLELSDIIDPFKGDKCPTLVGKPKIFILNACRGDDMDYGVEGPIDQVDSVTSRYTRVQRLPIDADIFVLFSCTEGYTTLRDEISGSYFVQDLCRVFLEYGKTLHLNELVLKVKEMVAARQTVVQGSAHLEFQMPVVLDTLRKLVYFDHKTSITRQPSADITRMIRLFE
ncbi:hypothetical protein LOTGIDRAFT_210703 [Lottia gigantea]|uniref:Caspase family p20 domain-containing protein n=1 Tax=Lottia gigantea TaxID=225164 RepID=V3ZXM4_LOTGI|nr:hypothetical protein LOTGIDRAFT_210703 [Lottia gigantea]ESO87340.1 hypothetical protein LOTGIDRAFT_210703 [Lottia gigantea]